MRTITLRTRQLVSPWLITWVKNTWFRRWCRKVRMSLFNAVSDSKHEIYFILHQLVPQSLVANKAALTRQIIFEFFTSVQQLLYQTIWTKHNNNLCEWEKSQHISKKNKRWYRRPTKTTSTNLTSHTTQDSPNLSPDDIILTPPPAPMHLHPFFLPFPYNAGNA